MTAESQKPSREDMEGRLLDYLYGELEPDAREAFERALPAFPEVAAELERHRWTRSQMAHLPVVALPSGALAQALAAADAAAAAAAPAEAKPSLWERLRRLVVQPSFAMAMVALLGVGIGLYTMKGGRLPSEPAPVTDQEASGRSPVAVSPVVAAKGAPTPAAPIEAPAAAPAAAEQAPELAAALNEEARREAAVDGAPKTVVADPSAAASGPGAAAAPTPTVARTGDDLFDAKKEERARTAPGDPMGGVAVAGGTSVTEDFAGKADRVADEDQKLPLAKSAGGEADVYREGTAGAAVAPNAPAVWAPSAPTPDSATAERVVLATEQGRNVADDERPTDAAVLTPPRTESKDKSKPAVAIDDEAEARSGAKPEPPRSEPKPAPEKKPADAPRTQGDAADSSNTQTPSGVRPAQTNPPPAPKVSEDGLWTTYGQQLAAGAWADAQKTLAELAKLAGETEKVKAARTALGKKVDAAKRAEADRAKPAEKAPPDPNAPVPGKQP